MTYETVQCNKCRLPINISTGTPEYQKVCSKCRRENLFSLITDMYSPQGEDMPPQLPLTEEQLNEFYKEQHK